MRSRALAWLVLLVALVACGTGTRAKPSASAPRRTTALLAQNLALFQGEAQAVRLGFKAAASSTDIIVNFSPDTAQVALCPLADLADSLPPVATCKSVGSGVRETISSPGLGAIAIVLSGVTSAGANVLLEYDDVGRAVSALMPFIPAPEGASVCKDNGCNPFFEVRPIRNGLFTAKASWSGSAATLVMLQGSVLARSLTATGIPYREAALRRGSTSAQIRTQLTTPGEYALAIMQTAGSNTQALTDVRIDASWP
jgi:hypothetical protein